MSFSHNEDGTIYEGGEGTLTRCKCGREFFLSFREGFECSVCLKERRKKFNEKVREVLSDEGIQNIFREYANRDQSSD